MSIKTTRPLREALLWFMTYAVIGWCYEVFLEVVVYRWGYSDRGVLVGPYCPIYGVGALLFVCTIYRLIRYKPLGTKLLWLPVIFLGCAAIATGVELIASYLCELAFGSWPWQTYVDYSINFQGRIALSPSLRFGLGGVIFLYVLQPLLEKATAKLNPKVLYKVSTGLLVLLAAEVTYLAAKTLL